ncbi:hypothetical protein [Pseudomonas paracarnis]|uniref:hypothetical protein n=1 Tax=Pseudomonas paracarnis TaxID=2750625 RepID=UPI002FE22B92
MIRKNKENESWLSGCIKKDTENNSKYEATKKFDAIAKDFSSTNKGGAPDFKNPKNEFNQAMTDFLDPPTLYTPLE